MEIEIKATLDFDFEKDKFYLAEFDVKQTDGIPKTYRHKDNGIRKRGQTKDN
jgi:hypothetical protein